MSFPDIIGQPPGALQVAALTLPSRSSGSTNTKTDMPAAAEPIQTSGDIAFAIPVESNKLGEASAEATAASPNYVKSTPILSMTNAVSIALPAFSTNQGHPTRPQSSLVVAIGSNKPDSRTTSQPSLTTGKETQQLPVSVSSQDSHDVAFESLLAGTVMTSNPASNGQASNKPASTIVPTTGVTSNLQDIPEVSVTDGHVLVQGHTLDMNETVTLGSGSVVTRVALKTNGEGETIFYGDTITTSPHAKSVTTIAPIMPSGTLQAPSTTDPYFTEKPSLANPNEGLRSYGHFAYWTLWMGILMSSLPQLLS